MSLSFRNPSTGLLERVAGFNDTDIALDPSSKNPVANKTIYAALAQKIDKTVNDLVNYYKKSETYSQEEIRALIGAINTLTIEVVASLPTQDISTTTIYFVGPTSGKYDEYVYVNNAWVKLGDTEIDLSSYATKEYVATALQSYYTKTEIDTTLNDYYDKDAVDDLLNTKQDTLTFDNTPISGSPNPVTSAGIKTALDNILISGNGGSIIKVHHLAGAAAAGNIVTASKGDYSVSSTFDVSGDAIIIGFGEIGNIMITATNGSETGSTVINIPNFSVYETTVSYGLDYNSWLIAGGVDPSYYESLDEVLEDEEVVRRLMTIHASVDYLATLDRTNDEMAITVLNNDICAKWINLRDYALDTLYANTYAKTIMDDADKYGYGEWALMPQVPTMTSDTAPYGEAFASSTYTATYSPYKVFDGNTSTYWNSVSTSAPHYVGYKFTKPICVKRVMIQVNGADDYIWFPVTAIIQGSNDGSTWDDIETVTNTNTGKLQINIHDIDNDTYYLYYRITKESGQYSIIGNIQFYAWQPKGNVPAMTSDTAPYGQVLSDGYEGSRYAWYAFDGNENTWWDNGSGKYTLGYAFTNPICSKRLKLYAGHQFNFDIEGSNDDTNWTKIGEGVSLAGSPITVDFSNSDYYLRYRINVTNLADFSIRELQFYGREMKVSVPTMTSNTAPYGEVSANSYDTGYYPYFAFTDASGSWGATTAQWIGYEFPKPVIIKKFYIKNHYYNTSYERGYIQAFVNNEWINISTEIYALGTNELIFDVENIDNIQAKKIRFKIDSCQYSTLVGTAYINRIQFYGFDYTERDWDIEHPMKYIYDHGVELETISDDDSGFSWGSGSYTIKAPTKRLSDIELIGVSNNFPMLVTSELINCADYSYLFIKTPQFTNSTNHLNYGISSTKAIGASIVAQKNLTNEVIGGLNISSATGQYYIYGQNSWNNSNCYVDELWLE